MNFLRCVTYRLSVLLRAFVNQKKLMSNQLVGDLGSGTGKRCGGGGAIRKSGDSFNRRVKAAKEEEYFYKTQKEQLQKLKSAVIDQQIKRREDIMSQYKQQVKGTEE